MRNHVYRLKRSQTIVLDVQASILDDLRTRAVVPLESVASLQVENRRFLPLFEVAGETRIMMTHKIAAVERTELGEMVTLLDHHHDTITAALDFLFQGY